MKILVIGGTGLVGSAVVRELVAQKMEVTVLTRDAAKTKALPAGVSGVIGDLKSPATIRSIFNGMDGVFLLNVVSPTETHEGLMAVNGMRLCGVRRAVYMSVQNIEQAPYLPHFGSKLPVEVALKDSGIPTTILRPNNFYQNDYWFKDVLLGHGVYPQPLGTKGLSRVDVRDIAEAAAIALATGKGAGETFVLAGPDELTGPGTAETWSRVIGKPIVYGGDDLDAWEQQALAYLPDWMAFDFRMMYAFFQEKGLKATKEEIDHLTKLLGHPPRTFEAFAGETAAVWKKG